jgi:hypothetical protein
MLNRSCCDVVTPFVTGQRAKIISVIYHVKKIFSPNSLQSHICLFSGWLREFYGPGFLEVLAPRLVSRNMWVFVVFYYYFVSYGICYLGSYSLKI